MVSKIPRSSNRRKYTQFSDSQIEVSTIIHSGGFPYAVFIFREEHEQQRTLARWRLDGHALIVPRSKTASMRIAPDGSEYANPTNVAQIAQIKPFMKTLIRLWS
jgi:hypothetical protein